MSVSTSLKGCRPWEPEARSGAALQRRAAYPRERLASSPIFSHLEDRDVDRLLEVAEIVGVGPGEIIIRRGDPGNFVLFILSGSVSVEAEGPGGRSVRLNLLKPGEIFGEMAALQDARRSATVKALEACEFLIIPRFEFLSLLVGHPSLAIQTLGSVVDRLGSLTEVVGGLEPAP